MKHLNRLLQKQISKPQTYQRLKSNPFPFLNDCNRLQIFQFIYQLQKQNQRLRGQIEKKYPDQTMEQIIEKHQKIRIRRQMKAIQALSIQNMEIEVRSKMSELQNVTQETKMLQAQIEQTENQMLELQTERRQKELQRAMAEGRKPKDNCSQIFKQLYGDVKNILEDSL